MNNLDEYEKNTKQFFEQTIISIKSENVNDLQSISIPFI